MPSKRVSLKGKGADLFFGDYAPPNQDASAAAGDDPTTFQAAPEAQTDQDAATTETQTAPAAPAADPTPGPSRRQTSRPGRSPRSEAIASTPASNDARAQDSDGASTLASTIDMLHDGASDETVETIRKIVKSPGKEVSFVRLTPEEKARLVDLVYTFKRQGQKTSETEINRIALNYLLHDFHEHGERSVLARVLAALLA